VLPLAFVPVLVCSGGVAYVSWSGDIFALTAMAASLAVWLHFHLKGLAASRRAVLLVGALAGFAAGSKQTGVLAVVAYAA